MHPFPIDMYHMNRLFAPMACLAGTIASDALEANGAVILVDCGQQRALREPSLYPLPEREGIKGWVPPKEARYARTHAPLAGVTCLQPTLP